MISSSTKETNNERCNETESTATGRSKQHYYHHLLLYLSLGQALSHHFFDFFAVKDFLLLLMSYGTIGYAMHVNLTDLIEL